MANTNNGRKSESAPTKRLSAVQFRFGYLVHDVSRVRRTLMDQWLKPLGITRSQWSVLSALSRGGAEGMMQVDLARLLDVGKVTVGGLVDRLEATGHVMRLADGEDRRAKRVLITEQGYELFGHMIDAATEINKRMLEGVTPEDLAITEKTLFAVKTNVRAAIKEGGQFIFPTDESELGSDIEVEETTKPRRRSPRAVHAAAGHESPASAPAESARSRKSSAKKAAASPAAPVAAKAKRPAKITARPWLASAHRATEAPIHSPAPVEAEPAEKRKSPRGKVTAAAQPSPAIPAQKRKPSRAGVTAPAPIPAKAKRSGKSLAKAQPSPAPEVEEAPAKRRRRSAEPVAPIVSLASAAPKPAQTERLRRAR